ncbi:MAG: DUF2946 family protein [Rhodocyclaceae bacterium]|nr:DUF2946 family protein [Rhodocyclaceae bacterium]
MLTSRAQRRISLLALFVLLWGLVFPAHAAARAAQPNTRPVWTEVCTSHGIKKIQQSVDAGQASGQHHGVQHCALCCTGSALIALEPLRLSGGVWHESPTLQLPELHVALPQQIILLNAPPRAPPVLSRA